MSVTRGHCLTFITQWEPSSGSASLRKKPLYLKPLSTYKPFIKHCCLIHLCQEYGCPIQLWSERIYRNLKYQGTNSAVFQTWPCRVASIIKLWWMSFGCAYSIEVPYRDGEHSVAQIDSIWGLYSCVHAWVMLVKMSTRFLFVSLLDVTSITWLNAFLSNEDSCCNRLKSHSVSWEAET